MFKAPADVILLAAAFHRGSLRRRPATTAEN
jgi:hypothetical protein